MAPCTLSQTILYKYEFGFKNDNDAYLGIKQDKYYTNGLFITFRGVMNKKSTSEKINKRLWEFEIDQKIYTPQSGYISDVSYIDRPFAGYLCVNGSLYRFYNSENLLKTTLQIGVLGPASLAEETQTFLHQIAGFYTPKGWETQIHNKFALNAMIDYYYFLHRDASQSPDFTAISSVNIGTAFTDIDVGLLFRVGKFNRLFNSASTNSRIANHVTTDISNSKELFFYAKPMLNYRLYDATVEGELSYNSQQPLVFGIKPFVFSQEIGITYATNRWTTNFSVIFKTKEIQGSAKPHQYASISLYYRFGQVR